MTDNDTTTGAPGVRVETAEEFAERLMGVMDWKIEMTTMIEQRDAAIDARARREARAAALEEVDLVLRRLRLLYGDMGHAIAAVRALATPDAAPEGSDGGVAL